ncbi:TPA: hypothetical protein QDA94_004128 [Burkholderia vietnamiensis]|uniref:hypothetical protein n=1 Tax=Burkholderia cepacia complex TaxID=87882 RepID=UPI0015932D1F|nr:MULTISPECIES: hypothetical protein [Burkholderia cepacia complex]MBU9658341.1 hypothetical protein [Burkholderia cenocepacia]HDR8918806.1 hypothetical protein [Burkholderia vietnamiensis]HDR8976997.1 hypothetical protein [Burkholderia vietnamiensis]HDR9049870.1 hypothetical protein [Burkholderia vietnamiensis]HDR9191211.1 hypothetical protein [Burkholderia vietnamiensis]
MHSHPSVARIAPRLTLPRLIALALALGATSTSAWISIVAGIERGGTSAERIAWAAVALVVLLAAHLLPALTRGEPLQLKLPAMALWLVCLVGTGYGHATFFLSAQQHAGARRASAIETVEPNAPTQAELGRPRDVVARDQARVTQLLANARAESCVTRCAQLRARREALAAQLTALGVEAEMAQRREQAADRVEAERQLTRARKDKARIDPVTSRVAQLFALSCDGVDLAIALLFGLLLECVACLGWLQGLPRRVDAPVGGLDPAGRDEPRSGPRHGSSHDYRPTEQPVTDVAAVESTPVMQTQEALAPLESTVDRLAALPAIDADVLRLANAIAAGHVRATVADIRRYMRCSQARASHLRRRVLSLADIDTPAVIDREAVDTVTPSRPRLVHSLPARVA